MATEVHESRVTREVIRDWCRVAQLCFQYSGLRAVWLKFSPDWDPSGLPPDRKPATGLLWLIGIYVALFGLANERYLTAQARIDAERAAFQAALSSAHWKESVEDLARLQLRTRPREPRILWPPSVVRSFFGQAVLDRAHRTQLISFLEWRRGDLEGIKLFFADLDGIRLYDAQLRNSICVGCSLVDAVLSNTDLGGANLGSADLRGATLDEANLAGAWLENADLRRANLHGANIEGARLRCTDLRGAEVAWELPTCDVFKGAVDWQLSIRDDGLACEAPTPDPADLGCIRIAQITHPEE